MIALCWEYLTGKAVASVWDDRTIPEWPPHPDRVFQALVAAWGETGRDPALRESLLWLERQPPPALAVPEAISCTSRLVFVPVNDLVAAARTRKYTNKMLALLPSQRNKAPRHFPAHTVGGVCALIWPAAEPDEALRSALSDLCARVTHIGHSSSLVRIWLDNVAPAATMVPATSHGDRTLRVPHAGRLGRLIAAYADGGPGWQRPPVARWQDYRHVAPASDTPGESFFGEDWLIYRVVASPRFSLAQTLAVTDGFRKLLIAAAERVGSPAAKASISGHAADGTALATPHLAYLPLGFVGHEHADGHLLGLAVVWPRRLDYETRDACLAAIAHAEDHESGEIAINFTSGDRLTLVREERKAPPVALTPRIWCRPAARWATVTPIALDRMPRRREGLSDGWAARQIEAACVRIGLPAPASIAVLQASRLTGAPSCHDVPHLARRTDRAPRWHVHAEVAFPQLVRGPVLLGAGRYRGYGFCRPLAECGEEAQA